MRSIIIPSFFLINLDKRQWCFNYCPFGCLQDAQKKIVKKNVKLPKYFSFVRYLILLLVLYFLTINANHGNKSVYSVNLIVMIIALIIFLLGFFVHRAFCNYVCPIGTVGDIGLEIEKK
ncbi:4Fe-4S binding protein [Candidatus Woesearchaeota archaeon]|nr:4Fe-4S binding protein [Candidatus Woesearchaeota archaeon]